METLTFVCKSLLVVLAIASIVMPFSTKKKREVIGVLWSQTYRCFRVKMFFETFGIFLITIIVVLIMYQIPGLKYGWANIFFEKGGNIAVTPIMEGSKSTNILVRLAVPIFFLIFAILLPLFARFEEVIFRKGYNDWKSILKQSIKFGFIHCLVGVPIAAGIALIIPGFFYGYKYKCALDHNVGMLQEFRAEEEAIVVSTTYHTVYNAIVVVIVTLLMVWFI